MPDNNHPLPEFVLDLSLKFPNTPFLALGQTALWDEPVKAVLLETVATVSANHEWFAGVHDTDYFAKTIAHIATNKMFVAVPHDDGMTKDLWSAAGEISALFGSESVPTRQMYRAHGVPFDWLRDIDPAGRREFTAKHTQAWGWLGLVQTLAYNLISQDVSLREITDPLLNQLDWAVTQSTALLVRSKEDIKQEIQPQNIRHWIIEFLKGCNENCRLPDLYENLLPKMYTLLSPGIAPPFTTKTSRLLQFNRATCNLPRFDLVNHFINPVTRNAATESYNQAVAGSAVYNLDHFGEGALPFDLVIPGLGRGTIRILSSEIVIDTDPEETHIAITKPITGNSELAEIFEGALGPHVVVVGKAITLIDMIAAEYLVVFHEGASGYTPTTRAFNDRLRVCGINLTINPLIRLKYSTWDSLQSVSGSIEMALPDHLAAAFGKRRVKAVEFGSTWHSVVQRQEEILAKLKALSSPKLLMGFLSMHQGGEWSELRLEYEQLLSQLRIFRVKTASIVTSEHSHKSHRRDLVAKRRILEKAMGDHWRNTIQPLKSALGPGPEVSTAASDPLSAVSPVQENIASVTLNDSVKSYCEALEIRCQLYTIPLKQIESDAVLARVEARRLRQERRAFERSPEVLATRSRVHKIVEEAERARLEMVKTAFLTFDSLTHTNHRPTAWWFPLVDPDGAWIDTVRKTAVARLEDLVTPLK